MLAYQSANPYGTADGIFGNKTVEAVKAFQSAEGLTVDGIAGQQTLDILAARMAGHDEPEEQKEPERTELVELREHLKQALEIVERLLK